ncbi:DUF3027 domain-containing protein [Cellulomonas sp. URHB0016]
MAAATKDAVLRSAVDLAREVAVGIAEDPADVGEYLGLAVEGERLVSHRFACTARGYRGWEWTVTVARVPRGRTATVCEAELLPGEDAILGKAWVPWAERLQPGDIGPGDVLPFRPDDPRLEPGWTPSGDPELDEVAIEELALARVRVLSPQGRDEAAERWYRGSHGPTTAGALASSAACYSCGFLVPLQGSLGTVFGVCANEWSPDDGRVVSLDHGCGAHSETDAGVLPSEWPAPAPLIDEMLVESVDRGEPRGRRDRAAAAAAAVARDLPTGDAPVAELATEDVPVEDAPVEDAPVAELATEDVPAEDAPVEDAPVAELATEDVPAEDAPVEDAPVGDAPVAELATEDLPVGERPAQDAPADEARADDGAADGPATEPAPEQ